MKIKRVKQDYQGLIITRNNMLVGNITLDTSKVQPEQMANFQKIGFEDVFEDVEVCDNCRQEKCSCKKALTEADALADVKGIPRPDFNKSSLEEAAEQVKEYTKPKAKTTRKPKK